MRVIQKLKEVIQKLKDMLPVVSKKKFENLEQRYRKIHTQLLTEGDIEIDHLKQDLQKAENYIGHLQEELKKTLPPVPYFVVDGSLSSAGTASIKTHDEFKMLDIHISSFNFRVIDTNFSITKVEYYAEKFQQEASEKLGREVRRQLMEQIDQ